MSQENQVYCTHCGAAGFQADQFCRQCGKRRSRPGDPGSAAPSRSVGTSYRRDTSPSVGGSGDLSRGGRGEVERDAEEPRRVAPPPPDPGLVSQAESRYGAGGFGSGNGDSEASASQGGWLPDRTRMPGASYPQVSPGFGGLTLGGHTLALSGAPTPGALAAPPALMPAFVTCNACLAPLAPGANHCSRCGSSRALVSAGMCYRCGAGNPASNQYCGRCGALIVSNALTSQRPTSSALPVIGSMILPGLGQMMNGEALKGFMLLGAALLMISQGATIFSLPYLLITAIASIDAAVGRTRRERGPRPHRIEDPA